jgi:peptide deformylase
MTISMTNILPIAHLGAAVLRQQAQLIDFPLTADLQELIDGLIRTADQSNGVGIAAPQVANSCRLFIVASRPSPRYPQAPTMEPTAMINPQIIDRSPTEVLGWEGCLSVPGQRGLVARAQWIEVEYLDRFGQLHQQHLTDFVARIFQHEYDHLEGILFVDRVTNPDHLISEEEYQKIQFDPIEI